MPHGSIRVRVSGDYACFTRPETKVERFTYPVMTPSAARNILDAICWRPQMRWIVTSISVLKPIRTLSVLRNEVQKKVPDSVTKWMRDVSSYKPLVAGAGDGTDGTPRNTTLLREVAYWIDAYPLVFDRKGDNTEQKYLAMMERRVAKGQCFQRPYLGCREFAAEFSPALPDDQAITESMPLGRMLYDIAFLPAGNRAVFFDAKLVKGVLDTDPALALAESGSREDLLRRSHDKPDPPRPSFCAEEVVPCSPRC
jgi:CRISPR-associated protein Cas5d